MLKAAKDAGIAQQVEHLICNQGVTGSNPVAGTTFPQNLTAISGAARAGVLLAILP